MTGLRRILATVLIATLAWPCSPAHAQFPNKTIFVDGVPYALTQDRDSKGRITKEIIASPEFSEITIDADGDGINEHWEVSSVKDGVTVSAMAPYHGQYTRLEVEQRRKHGFVKLVFAYQRINGNYQLVSSSFQPYGYHSAQGAEEIVYGGKWGLLCRTQDAKIHEEAADWRAILDRVTNGENSNEKLKCLFDYYEKTLFEESCFSPQFQASLDDMKRGIAEVLLSVYTKTDSSKGTRASYLQCLNENGLNTHAARIQREFNQLFAGILDRSGGDAILDKFGKLGKDAFCKEVKSSKLKEAVSLNRSGKPFTCFLDKNSTDVARYYDDFKQVAFLRPIGQLDKPAGFTSQHTYGSFAFHELLHGSKIDNEDLTYSIQWCCGDALPDDSPPCKRMSDILNNNKKIELYEANLGQQSPSYLDFRRDEIDVKFGTGLGNTLMTDYFQQLDKETNGAELKYRECMATASSEASKTTCLNDYKKKMVDFTKSYFNDPTTCKAFVKYAQKPSAINCADMGQKMVQVIGNIGNSIATGPIPARKPGQMTVVDNSGNPVKAQVTGTGDQSEVRVDRTGDSGQSAAAGSDVLVPGSGSSAENEARVDRTEDAMMGSQSAGLMAAPDAGSANTRDQAANVPPKSDYVGPKAGANSGSSGGPRRSSNSWSRNPASSPKINYSQFGPRVVQERTRRATPLLNAGGNIASLIKDAVLPTRAEAATSDVGGGDGSSHSRGVSFVSPKYAALQERSIDIGKPILPNVFLDSSSSSSGTATVKSAGSQQVAVSLPPSSSGGGASARASTQAAGRAPDKADMPGTKTGKAQVAEPNGAVSNSGEGLGSQGRNSASVQNKDGSTEVSDEFKTRKQIVDFITGDYKKVWERLNSPDRWSLNQALVDPKIKIRIIDHRGSKHGSEKPSVTYVYCPTKSKPGPGLTLEKDCQR